MTRLLIIFTVLTTFFSCQTDNVQTIEGDLSFKLIDLQRMFDMPDSILTRIEQNAKTINRDTLSLQDQKIYGWLKCMVDNNLLRKPYIWLRLDNGDMTMLFLDTLEYRQFQQYNRGDLSKDDKKIRIKAEAAELRYNSSTAYNTTKLISVDKVNGETYWEK